MSSSGRSLYCGMTFGSAFEVDTINPGKKSIVGHICDGRSNDVARRWELGLSRGLFFLKGMHLKKKFWEFGTCMLPVNYCILPVNLKICDFFMIFKFCFHIAKLIRTLQKLCKNDSLSIPIQFWSRNSIDSDLGTPLFPKKIEKKSKSLQVQDYLCLQCHGLYSVNISKLSNARCFCFEIAGQLDLWYWNAFSKTAISNSKYLSIIW